MKKYRLIMIRISITLCCFLIAACGGGGGSSGGPAPSVTLQSSGTEQLVGESVSLTWSSINASSCSAAGDWAGEKSLNGTEDVSISSAKSFTFTLSCIGPDGTAVKSLSVTGYQNLQGVVVDGYMRGADVFIDVNSNLEVDGDEVKVLSDNDGKFELKYVEGKLISIGGFDLASGNLLDSLVMITKLDGYAEFAAITPITTLASFLENPGDINAMLGIDPSINVSAIDPVATFSDGNIYATLYQRGAQLTVLALATQSLSKTDQTFQETSIGYFEILAAAAAAAYEASSTPVNLSSATLIADVIARALTKNNITISDDRLTAITNSLVRLLPVVGAEVSGDSATAVFTFATSTFLTDIESIASGESSEELVEDYTGDVINVVVVDQNIENTQIDELVTAVNERDDNAAGDTDDNAAGDTDDNAAGDTKEPSVVAFADITSTDEDKAVTIYPLSNDTIVTAGYTTAIVTSGATNGSVVVNSNQSLTYTPTLNFFGSDTFNYTVTINSVSATASVTITVNGVNDLPIINSLSSTLTPDENQTAVVTVNASDIETSSLDYSVTGTDSGLFSISTIGVLTFDTAPDYESPGDANKDNSYSITITASDGTASTSQAISVEVQNMADVVSGAVVDGYVAGATVFQDLDNDGELDSGEPNTSTNALGSFSLTLTSVSKTAPVRIINGYDLATNEIHPSVMDISSTESGSYIITPISTLVGRLKIADSTLVGTVPQSMVAAALGITMAESPNDSILGFDPIAYFNGSDSALAAEARPVFAASQLLMAQGGGNYAVNKYITDQVLSTLSTTLSTASGSSISMTTASDITAIKQDAFDAIFNGIVDTTLADNPPINNVQFKSNKAVMTDYLNGSSASQVQHSLYGVHDGNTTLVANLVGAKLDYENLTNIINNDGTGMPLDLSFKLSSLPQGSGSTTVTMKLFYGSDAIQDSTEDYMQVGFTVNWESDGSALKVKLPANNTVVTTFFDRTGTTITKTTTNNTDDFMTTSKSGPNTLQSLTIKLSKLFSGFPSDVSGLGAFLDGAATFTYLVEFGNFSMYDHLENSFTKIQGNFAVSSSPDIAIYADDIYVHENATTEDMTFRLSQASSSAVTVDYSISGLSSASASDYSLSAGTVTIPAGSMSATLPIAVTNDATVEAQEEIRLSLSNPQNAVLGRSVVSAYITDGEKILDNTAQKAILVTNVFKDSKSSINSYIKSTLDATTVTISGTSYTYSQVLVNKSLTSDVYAYIDSIVDDYEVVAEAVISAIMTKSNTYVDSELSNFTTYTGFAKSLTQLNSGLKGLNVSQIVGTNISNDGSYPSGQSAATLLTAVEGKVNTLVTLAADTVADILGTDTSANFPNANVIIGTDGNDTIAGTSGSDLIASFNGTDTVNAGAGNDKILGGSGVDTINGGDNNDDIYGYAGNDILAGDSDDDKILGGLDNDTIKGGAGDDDLRGEAGNDTIYPGKGSDTVTGGLGDDTIIIDEL